MPWELRGNTSLLDRRLRVGSRLLVELVDDVAVAAQGQAGVVAELARDVDHAPLLDNSSAECLYNRGVTVKTTPEIHLIDALADPTSAAVEETLGDDVRFRSPYADYQGRGDVAHLVSLIRDVLIDIEPMRRLRDDGITISLFEARVAEDSVQGLLYEQHDDAGQLVDATLTIRPYAGLRAAMNAMQVRLEAAPLPSAG